MSDPVTNVEIEDVLSSIRRLVSEDGRAPRGAQRPAPERLVLSPALRVPEAKEISEPAIDEGDLARQSHAPMVLTEPSVTPVSADSPLDADNAETLVLGAENSADTPPPAVSEWQDTQVAESHDPRPDAEAEWDADSVMDNAPLSDLLDIPQTIPEDPVPEDIAEADQIAALRASLTDILVPEAAPEVDDETAALARVEGDCSEGAVELDCGAESAGADTDTSADTELERKIATLEQMLHRQSEDWVPAPPNSAEATELAEATAPAEALADTDIDDADPQVDDPNDPVAMEPAPGDALPADSPTSDTLIKEIVSAAAMATVADHLGETDKAEVEQVEPLADLDAPNVDAPEQTGAVPGESRPAFVRHAPTAALDWEDHAPGSDPLPEPLADADAQQSTAVAELSEEALQAMVSEIVRQELQGALGERITRNVRKLVRREIHRVLMSQDLD